MRPMRRRHVRIHRHVAAAPVVAGVGCHALAAQQQLHAVAGHPGLQRLAHQRVRHAVAVPFEFDVVVALWAGIRGRKP